MSIDLTSNRHVTRLRGTVTALRAERDELRQRAADVDTLYDELAAREDKIADLEAKVARLEARGIEALRATIAVYQAALAKIAEGGRGAKKIAAAALAQE